MGPRMNKGHLAVCLLLMALTSGTVNCYDEFPHDKSWNLTSLQRNTRSIGLAACVRTAAPMVTNFFSFFIPCVYKAWTREGSIIITVENRLDVALENPGMGMTPGNKVNNLPLWINPCQTIIVEGTIGKESKGIITWDISGTNKMMIVSWEIEKELNGHNEQKLFVAVKRTNEKGDILDRAMDKHFWSQHGVTMPKRTKHNTTTTGHESTTKHYEEVCKKKYGYKICGVMGDSSNANINVRLERKQHTDMDQGSEESIDLLNK